MPPSCLAENDMSKKLACFLILLAVACGKAGPPTAPVPEIPKAVTDLVVSQRGTKVILRWSYPSLSTSGKTLTEGIRKIVVYRYDEPLPQSLVPQLTGAEAKPVRDLFAKIDGPRPIQYPKVAAPVAEINGDNLPAFSQGAKIVFDDELPVQAAGSSPMRYTYAVVTEGKKAASGLSNFAPVVPLDVATAPGAFAAKLTPEAVVLTWDVPKTAKSGAANPAITGYTIYRSITKDVGDALTTVPPTEAKFADKAPYGTYTYAVTAQASGEPSVAESALSTTVAVDFKDLLPPPVPANVTALAEETSVRLVWDPVDAPDLAGYIVYRTSGGVRSRLTPALLTETNFRDATTPAGVPCVYSVTSVDKSVNESAEAKSAEVQIAK
jgi:hypothetical protein